MAQRKKSMHNKGLDTLPEIAAAGAENVESYWQREAHRDDVEQVLSDPKTSYWLHDALSAALVREPVVAANDALVLARLLKERAYQLAGMARAMSHGF